MASISAPNNIIVDKLACTDRKNSISQSGRYTRRCLYGRKHCRFSSIIVCAVSEGTTKDVVEFPPFLPPEVRNVKDPAARQMARRIQRLPVQTNLSKQPIMSSCVMPKTQDMDTTPAVFLHGFDSSCLEWRYAYPLIEAAGVESWAVDLLGWGFTNGEGVTSFSVAAKREHLYEGLSFADREGRFCNFWVGVLIQTNMAAAKGEAIVPNQRVSKANNNRRALGDIGNIAVDAGGRGNVTKEGVNGRKPLAQVSRPITRSFGAQLLARAAADKGISAANITQAPVVIPKAEVVQGNKQRRTRKSKEIPPTTAVPKDESDDCVIIEQPHRVKPTCNRNAGGAGDKEKPKLLIAKPQSLTATLTSRSAVALYDFAFDDEMAEAEEDPLPNIDGGDLDNPLAVVEYVEDIYKFYRSTEHMSCVPDYMPRQQEINGKMRAVLINWLIEVHYRFGLMPETLYLTTNLLDRYLSVQLISRSNYQLVGATAMLLASKYEEIWAPEIDEFLDILENKFEREHVLVMEKAMLNKLKFHLTVPTPYVFFVRFLKAAGSDEEMENLVFYLMELSLMQYAMIKFRPSMLAAAAVYTARCTLEKTPVWNAVLKCHSGYSETDLKECTRLMVAFHQSSAESKLSVVFKKYSTPQYNSVALIKPAKLHA